MAGRKKIDPIKQREKRAKIAAIAGCILLLLVGAFEVPKMLKLMNKKPVVPPPTAAQVARPDGSTLLPDISSASRTAATDGELVDTDVPPTTADGGQLVSFDVFETKDPFRPQVKNVTPTGSASSGSAKATTAPSSPTGPASADSTPTQTTPGATVPSSAVPSTAVPSTVVVPATATPATTTPAAGPTVAISVNGVVSRVGRDGTFPTGKPVFRLVSWMRGEAQIGVVGGSYSTGDPTLTLRIGKPVTLQNTTDEQRYKLMLLSTP